MSHCSWVSNNSCGQGGVVRGGREGGRVVKLGWHKWPVYATIVCLFICSLAREIVFIFFIPILRRFGLLKISSKISFNFLLLNVRRAWSQRRNERANLIYNLCNDHLCVDFKKNVFYSTVPCDVVIN